MHKLHNACFGSFINGICHQITRVDNGYFTNKFLHAMPQTDQWLDELLEAAAQIGFINQTIPYDCFEKRNKFFRPFHPERVRGEGRERQRFVNLIKLGRKTHLQSLFESCEKAFVSQGTDEGWN